MITQFKQRILMNYLTQIYYPIQIYKEDYLKKEE